MPSNESKETSSKSVVLYSGVDARKGIYQPKYKQIDPVRSQAAKERGSGHNPNSRKALQEAQKTLRRCSREKCNRPAWKQAANGFCFLCFRKYCSPKKLANNPHETDMARIRYYRKMGPKLAEFVEECIAQPESDQFNLTQELAIARDLLDEAIGLYEQAKSLPDKDPRKNGFLATAGSLLATASKEVRETCRVGAEVFNTAKDKYSVHTLVDVVSQIKRMIRQCFEHDPNALEVFDSMLNDRLRLPKIGADGTMITPDADVIAMDDTVPRIIDSVATEPTANELLLLSCPQCNQQFNHPDLNCVCPQCNIQLQEVAA